jgi:hypothetical protein
VLKQSWRPSTSICEGDIYPAAEVDNVNKVYSFEDVRDDPKSQVVDTKTYVRGDLLYDAPLASSERNQYRKRENEQVREAEERERYLLVTAMSDQSVITQIPIGSRQDPTFRTQTRVLLENYGWPIQRFRDLRELLMALRQAIHGKNTFTRPTFLLKSNQDTALFISIMGFFRGMSASEIY